MRFPEMLDNITKTVNDDLLSTIKKGDKLSIAAAYFSIYAFQSLKKQLNAIDELRFIFTSPTFIKENTQKEKREFYIPKLDRERSLYGTEFEVKLRNELNQKAIARECAAWIKEKVQFRSNLTGGNIASFMHLENRDSSAAYAPLNSFSTSDLGIERGDNIINPVIKSYAPHSDTFLTLFNQVWNDKSLLKNVTDEVLDSITAAYQENAPEFIYFVALYNIFNEFLDDLSADELPKEAVGFKKSAIWNKLYDFQKDAALAIINKLEKYNGCILADSVGLGKTFTASSVVMYYELRNNRVLVLCPKKLSNNWTMYRENYKNNPLRTDRLRYDVLYHTDLNRDYGTSGGIDLAQLNWNAYDLIVIDESHNFRNGEKFTGRDRKENRYARLMNRVIKDGVKTKVLMLSATPVNNDFSDLHHQISLAYEGNAALINEKLDTDKSIDTIFRTAQTAFNRWSKLKPNERTTSNLLNMLDFDFFTLLDSVTIARSRKHIEKYYDMSSIGTFPQRLEPITLRPKLSNLANAIDYDEIYEQLVNLNLAIYMPTDYVLESKKSKYNDTTKNITRAGREAGIRRLMRINLLKRLESSVHSFKITLQRVHGHINDTIFAIDTYKRGEHKPVRFNDLYEPDFDGDDANMDLFDMPMNVKDIDINDMDFVSFRDMLQKDHDTLTLLSSMINDITPEHDTKLQSLKDIIRDKVHAPINPGNKKVLIFSAFADTADYLYQHIAGFAKHDLGLESAMITGTSDGKTTVKLKRTDLNTILTLFSPISKDRDLLDMPPIDLDILIATDCISEGQNLQDCDFCINYDIHWNPVRIIQRFGRIDRIGSKNKVIQLVNYWPNVELDKYLTLKSRVESRMKATVLTSTGDDNPIDMIEAGDLEYRRAQLDRLQHEVVDLEEMDNGISIMDLGLNEFRLDLLDYTEKHGSLAKVPLGLHTVVKASAEYPPGVIFVLKNRNKDLTAKHQNQLHPFYVVYVHENKNIVIDYLQPKKLMDVLRHICKGMHETVHEAFSVFNQQTNDGKEMNRVSELLYAAVDSIVHLNETGAIESLFKPGGTTALTSKIDGLDDFELICFTVVIE